MVHKEPLVDIPFIIAFNERRVSLSCPRKANLTSAPKQSERSGGAAFVRAHWSGRAVVQVFLGLFVSETL